MPPDTQTSETKRLTEWQLTRYRDCLRAYRQYAVDADGKFSTWRDVAYMIGEVNDLPPMDDVLLKKFAERLRKFVEGTTRAGAFYFPTPKAEMLDYIRNFILDENISLTSKEELDHYTPLHQTPNRLIEYLRVPNKPANTVPHKELDGVYRTRARTHKELVIKEMIFQRPSQPGIAQVFETETIFNIKVESGFDKLSKKAREEASVGIERYLGWAVLTPEDMLLFFLKRETDGANRYYHSLMFDFDQDRQPALKMMLLLGQNEHLDHLENIELLGHTYAASQKLESNIAKFNRVVVKKKKKDKNKEGR